MDEWGKSGIIKQWHITELYKKESNTDSCYNKYEPWKQAKWKKPDKTRTQVLGFHVSDMSTVGKYRKKGSRLVAVKGWGQKWRGSDY